ncbi:Holliday junction resolvase [Porphyromonas gingivicanis]|uniref:Crossover junction endodeoxyribonuclease RuvC n=1 Tax=Porphyromonas gingivicanis TaxID=266762 RepID=A0A0A2G9I4_9PORP|nr:crossover junction endodeoxyribonuclease RuvC [Porphyromonas gingivicanis]KGN99102.1 Holliday junction resolvase [Porphyromonas gingivicanis]
MEYSKERIILGIDPGTTVMGYGLLRIEQRKPSLIAMGAIELKKYQDHYLRLNRIFERITGLIEEFLPDEMALEAPFYGKNVQTMLKLGRAQGAAMIAGLQRGLPITEYAPMRIKQSITGNGNASKEQVAEMLQKILRISKEDMPYLLDATDGLAVALCHFYQTSNPLAATTNVVRNWADFARANPHKVKGLK